MRKAFAATTLAVVSLLALSGCVKYSGDLTVSPDLKVSGAFIIGADKTALRAMGTPADKVFDDKASPFLNGTVSEYADDTFEGRTYTFTDVSFDELAGDDGHSLRFTHEDGTIRFDGDVAVFEEDADEAVRTGADITFKVTFPGEVLESNGKVDGRTVTWTGDETGLDMTATADDGRATVPRAAWIGTGAAALLVVALAIIQTARTMRHRRPAAPPVFDGSDVEAAEAIEPSEVEQDEAEPSEVEQDEDEAGDKNSPA